MAEQLDIVDAHDDIVGKASRVEAHKKGLLHRIAYVMLFDPDGRIFMQKRSASKETYANCWEGSLSGHLLSGETYKEAAERELHEELGACVSRKHLKNIVEFGFNGEEERALVTLFLVKDFKENIELDEEEVSKGEFWTVKKLESEFKTKKFHPVFLKAWEELKTSKENVKEFI